MLKYWDSCTHPSASRPCWIYLEAIFDHLLNILSHLGIILRPSSGIMELLGAKMPNMLISHRVF